jgi:3-hydroxyacyl-[acyl-carrier-protein] dehydratase
VADGGEGALSAEQVLALVPHREPFRFIDAIHELDAEHIVASVRFRADADFYRGHFPGRPLTPGVLLVEAMAQAGVVAYGIYLSALGGGSAATSGSASAATGEGLVPVFTDAQVEFLGPVAPGERVVTTARKRFFRRRKLRAEVEMRREDGDVVCAGVLAGMAVSPGALA